MSNVAAFSATKTLIEGANNQAQQSYFCVIIHELYGPQEAKARLVRASSAEQAKITTRMGNPDVLQEFASAEDAREFFRTLGVDWIENIEEG